MTETERRLRIVQAVADFQRRKRRRPARFQRAARQRYLFEQCSEVKP